MSTNEKPSCICDDCWANLNPTERLRGMLLYLEEDVYSMIEEVGRPDTDEEPELAPFFLHMLADALDHFPGLAAFLDDRCKPTSLT
jgi:hypothetical protein